MAGWVKEKQKGRWGRKKEQKVDRNRHTYNMHANSLFY